MKLILIGIDGSQASTFQRGWTPYIESLIANGASLDLKEDLFSRGWAEIFTGKYATVTGAMYERPVLDGTYAWTDKFQIKNIPGFGKTAKPIWQVLNERGYRVGIMNVPATNPAPKVDGFFVSGGGGGGAIAQELVSGQTYPDEIRHKLNDNGYIIDERLPSLLGEKKLYNPSEFFSRMSEMVNKRTDSFIGLANDYDIDFGFIVYRSSVVTETLLLPEYKGLLENKTNINRPFIDAAKIHYQEFDLQIKKLVESYPDAEVVLVSDHGMATNKYSVNLNAFLIKEGFQEKSNNRRKTYDLIKGMRQWVPYSIRKRLKRSPMIKAAYDSMVTFDPAATLAFNITLTRNTFGFFINDKARFDGPVEESEIYDLINQIIEKFNNNIEVNKHKLFAKRNTVPPGDFKKYYPDIIVEMPDGYVPLNEYEDFFYQHRHEKKFDLRNFKISERSEKSRTPLAVIANGHWKASPSSEQPDLRVIYEHVMQRFLEQAELGQY